MASNLSLIQQLHLLAQNCGNACKSNEDYIKSIEASFTQAIAELARSSDNWTKLAAWATEQGFDPSDYTTTTSNSSN